MLILQEMHYFPSFHQHLLILYLGPGTVLVIWDTIMVLCGLYHLEALTPVGKKN